jgi:hypothetical protein
LSVSELHESAEHDIEAEQPKQIPDQAPLDSDIVNLLEDLTEGTVWIELPACQVDHHSENQVDQKHKQVTTCVYCKTELPVDLGCPLGDRVHVPRGLLVKPGKEVGQEGQPSHTELLEEVEEVGRQVGNVGKKSYHLEGLQAVVNWNRGT